MDEIETGTVEDTEVKVEREPATLSIRDSLKQKFEQIAEEDDGEKSAEEAEPKADEAPVAETEVVQKDKPILAPPADMNAAEKEAFLNPTTENAHILQSYLNRRAYETRSDYSRKMQEAEQLKRQTQGLYDVIQEHEKHYAKAGISLGDVARRAVMWDQEMAKNPVETALEWLDSYGLTVDQLSQHAYQAPQQQQPQYLTKQEAERIAEERYQAIQAEQQKKAMDYYNQQVVQSFMSSKPLFRDPETAAQLEAEMGPVVQALTQTGKYNSAEQVLETAYNYVVNGNPTFSGLLQRVAAKPAIEQQLQVVQKAKQAAKSITGSAGSGSPRVQAKNLRDNLQRRFSGD